MHILGKLENHHASSRKCVGSEKTREDPKFTPQDDLWHRDSLEHLKQDKTKIAKPEEGGESGYHHYHIIKFKCPVFKNNKTTRDTKKQGSVDHSKEKVSQ